jgi:hypothetical protein
MLAVYTMSPNGEYVSVVRVIEDNSAVVTSNMFLYHQNVSVVRKRPQVIKDQHHMHIIYNTEGCWFHP